MSRNIIQVEKFDESFETEVDGEISEIRVNGQNLMAAKSLHDKTLSKIETVDQKMERMYALQKQTILVAGILVSLSIFFAMAILDKTNELGVSTNKVQKRLQYNFPWKSEVSKWEKRQTSEEASNSK